MNWQEISIKTEKQAVDAITEILYECGAGGVSIEDPEAIRTLIAEDIWDAYEFPEEIITRDYITVLAYFPNDSKLEKRIEQLREALGILNTLHLPGTVKGIKILQVQEEDWANSWKAYYKTVRVSDRIVIKPSWETYEKLAGDMIIELDPGMAFGTGTHPTTVMCLRSLEKLIKCGDTVFDVGTGSGILSIAAAKLGAATVKAVDIDEVAVRAAQANVELNGVDTTVEVLVGNLLDKVHSKADVVVANIVADVIKLVSPDAARVVKTGGKYLTSGIIAHRAEEVIEQIIKSGFFIAEITREGEWVSVIAVREE